MGLRGLLRTGATGLEPATSGVTGPSGNLCLALVSQKRPGLAVRYLVPTDQFGTQSGTQIARPEEASRMATSFNGALVIREQNGRVSYEAKWRDSRGRQVERRVGPAWVERGGGGGVA